jgi:hypothetical protein
VQAILHLSAYEDGKECSKTSVYKIQTLGNYPEENIQHYPEENIQHYPEEGIQHTEHGESLKSRISLMTLRVTRKRAGETQ